MKKTLIRAFSLLLALWMAVLGPLSNCVMQVQAEEGERSIYFLNSSQWESVGAYIYGDKGELLGGWGSSTAVPADELGGDWLKVAVSELPPYSIIFYNKENDSERAEVYLPTAENLYVTAAGESYTSRAAAEAAVSGVDDTDFIYFLNSSQWESVGAYIYGDKGELLGSWGSSTAVPAEELGGDWLKVAVSELPPYSIIFYNKENDSERAEVYLPTENDIYVTVTSQSFPTQEAAEAAIHATPTTIYFLNFDGKGKLYDEVYVYAYAGGVPVAQGWPGVKAEVAADLGDNWYKAAIPANASAAPFTAIVNDGAGQQLGDLPITSYNNNYITGKADQVYTNQTDAEKSVGIVYETVVYFLNDQNWPAVNAYVYGQPGEALGSWPGKATDASALGENWRQITVPAKTPFNIIFFSTEDDAQRAELLVPDEGHVYIASNGGAYGSKLEAELDVGLADPSMGTTLHFYNYRQWGGVNGYFFTTEDPEDKDSAGATLGAGWPGKAADEDAETGDDWYIVFVPKNATEEPFWAIFNDGVNQTDEIQIKDKTNVYITPGGQKFDNAADAEAAAAQETLDDGCEEGPNVDIDGYSVTYSGAGAALPYVTYEAEKAVTNATVLPYATDYRESIQSEASGRQAVQLDKAGDYVEFTLTKPANSLVLRYAMPDSEDGAGIDATLSLYIDGTEKQNLDLTSRYAWVYGGYPYFNTPNSGNAHRFFDETRLLLGENLPAGATIRLQKDSDDSAGYYVIDFIECEQVAAPLAQPENSLSVTDYGAMPNDGQDDRAAFETCIAAAKEQGKEVWIPVGTFDLTEKKELKAEGVTIRGAGMWHTNLYGAGAAFQYAGTSKFYDFAMTGVSTVRDDSGDPAGFENSGRNTNVTIQNIWMEHMKVGVWTANSSRLAIQGCRIRNTYADGINLCSGTSDSVVRNNSLRNTGDDCIAMWPWLSNETGNTVSHNTIQVPALANGVAIYGGGDHVVADNYIADTINNGAGIVVGSEFDTPQGFTGPVTVKNNVLYRCGSMQTDEQYMIGAIWIWNSFHHAMDQSTIDVYGNEMFQSPQVGITVEHNMDNLTGLRIGRNTIAGAKHALFSYLSGGGYGVLDEQSMTYDGITGAHYVYAEKQGAELAELTRSAQDGKVYLDGDKSDFRLEIATVDFGNTTEPTEPEEPAKPEEPTKPEEPGPSQEPTATEPPATSGDTVKPEDSAAPENQSGSGNEQIASPKTGDTFDPMALIAMMLVSGFALAALVAASRKRTHR